MTSVHVEFLMGLGGHYTSAGVDQMAAQVRKLGSNFTTEVCAWDQWRAAGAALKRLPPGTKRAIVGYSNGGSEVTGVSDMGFPIDLLVSLDPTIWISCSPLHGNVKAALCFHNANWASSFPPVGHARLATGLGWNPAKQKLTTIETFDAHINVDTDPVIQAVVIAAIKALGAQNG